MDIDSIFNNKNDKSGKRKLVDPNKSGSIKLLKVDSEEEVEFSSVQNRDKVDQVDVEDESPNGREEIAEDDEGGRFFGDGLDVQGRQVLDWVDMGDELEDEQVTALTVKKLILRLEKANTRNNEMRAKYPNEPQKFMESETDLDQEIKACKLLAQAPQLYPLLIELDAVQSILGLLMHENTDIASSCLELLNELIDEDTLSDPDQSIAPEELESIESGLDALIQNLIDNKFYNFLMQNIERFEERNEEERSGIFQILGIVESIGSIRTEALELILAETEMLQWIVHRIKFKNHVTDAELGGFDANAQYASEVLAILLQSSRLNRIKFCGIGGVDAILRILSQYKKRDPRDRDEIEFMENLFNSINSVLQENEGKHKFFVSEGIVLMLILMKSKKMCRIRAVETINFATVTTGGKPNCTHLVREGGLSPLFSALMKKKIKQYKKAYSDFNEVKDEEHCVGILSSLFVNLDSSSLEWARLLRKFFENDMEKVDRMVEIFLQYNEKMTKIEASVDDNLDLEALGGQLLTEDERVYTLKLENGLFTLQMAGLILTIMSYYEAAIRDKVLYLLQRRNLGLQVIEAVMREYLDGLGDDKEDVEDGIGLNYRVLDWIVSLSDDFVPPESFTVNEGDDLPDDEGENDD